MEPANELMSIIEKQLDEACKTNLPRLCAFCETPEGKETAANMVFDYCTNNGVSVQTAMAHIDSEV